MKKPTQWMCETCAAEVDRREARGWATAGRSVTQPGQMAHFCSRCFDGYRFGGAMREWERRQRRQRLEATR